MFCRISASHFVAKSRDKNRNSTFYPSAKGRRELKIKTNGVVFRGESASDVQKFVAPQKLTIFQILNFEFTDILMIFTILVFRGQEEQTRSEAKRPGPRSRLLNALLDFLA